MYAPALATRAGYTHRITYEKLTRYVGWQQCEFSTTGDAVELHLAALWIQQRIGREIRNINVALIASS